jgi:hypothetical protein
MAISTTRHVLQVEHVTLKTTKNFDEVEAVLEKSILQLDPEIASALATGDEQRATELEQGTPLFIFLKRDHGARSNELSDDPARRCSTKLATRTLHQR